MMLRSLTCFLLVLLSSTALQAQFSSSIKVLKRSHLIGEPVVVRVTLTNYTGQEQILHGQRMPWISFLVKSSSGNPIPARQVTNPKPIKIGAGKTMARDFDLSRQFLLNEVGNYSVSAVVRPNDNSIEGTTTRRDHFQMNTGRIYWRQKVGNVGPKRSTREFRLIQFSADGGTHLYAQIRDEGTGHILRTSRLGVMMTLRKPSITIDSEQHLHVLFLTTPTTYFHYRISPEGRVVTSDMHLRAATGDPKLTVMEQGNTIVTNSILYDPELEAKKRAMIRKITDRPGQ